jgi:adenylate kinase family enzyme
LGAQTGLPVHHMDHIHWMSGWQARPREQRKDMALAVENSAAWIFEGGFSTTYEHRATRADTLIWIDLPVGLRLWRVTKRLWRYYGQSRPDMAQGCPEKLHSESLLFYTWIWQTRASHRVRLLQLIEDHKAGLIVHHLTSRAAVAEFQSSLKM